MAYFQLLTILFLSVFTTFTSLANTQAEVVSVAERTMIDNKVVLGRIERVYFPGVEGLAKIGIPAKIDTGAETTSIHADNIRLKVKNPAFSKLSGVEQLKAIADVFYDNRLDGFPEQADITVSFSLRHPYTGELLSLERPLARLSIIKSRAGGGHLYRPVVDLQLQIAGKKVSTEVNLADRSRFSYPILIGKTFLRNTAWVDASYDYLQEQKNAKVIGRKEHAKVGKLAIKVSLSFANRYSMLHALDIKVDEQEKQVSFTLEGSDRQRQTMTLPIVRMLKFKKARRPLVYLPIQLGSADKANDAFNEHILVYLRDRSKFSSQLRLGSEALNQFFVVDLSKSYLADKPLQSLSTLTGKKLPFMMSAREQFTLDGVTVNAEPSVRVKTPLLKVSKIRETKSNGNRLVSYQIIDIDDGEHYLKKKIERKVSVGEQSRPVIESQITLPHTQLKEQLALATLDAKEGPQAQLKVGAKLVDGSLLVNTRTSNLLHKTVPVKAGYIEQAQIEHLSFPVKLDTGADVSSMHATNIKNFTKDGSDWVSFSYSNSDGIKQNFTREVVDIMRIKGRAGEKANIRPVVKMRVKLGHITQTVKVNLQNRGNFDYSMILGKNFLRHDIVVSSDKQFIFTEEQ